MFSKSFPGLAFLRKNNAFKLPSPEWLIGHRPPELGEIADFPVRYSRYATVRGPLWAEMAAKALSSRTFQSRADMESAARISKIAQNTFKVT